MIGKLAEKVFGSRNTRILSRYKKLVNQINQLEASMKSLSDSQLTQKTQEFRDRLQAGADVESLLPEAFAVVRETGQRVLGMRHFDVQLIGGMVLF